MFWHFQTYKQTLECWKEELRGTDCRAAQRNAELWSSTLSSCVGVLWTKCLGSSMWVLGVLIGFPVKWTLMRGERGQGNPRRPSDGSGRRVTTQTWSSVPFVLCVWGLVLDKTKTQSVCLGLSTFESCILFPFLSLIDCLTLFSLICVRLYPKKHYSDHSEEMLDLMMEYSGFSTS